MKQIPRNEYKIIMENMPILCVDLIIQKDKRILVGLRKDQPLKEEWWLPGGRIFKNERLREAVIRKAKEELNLKVIIEKELGTYEMMEEKGLFGDLKTGIHTLSVVFQVYPLNEKEIKLNESHEEYKWISPKDSPEKLKEVLVKLKVI